MNLIILKKFLRKMEYLPEIDFLISPTGLTITCERLETPRFVPFDLKGKCDLCKSNTVEMDYIISKEGVTLSCTRMKGEKFVPFDIISNLPDRCYFRIKTRGKVFTIPYEKSTSCEISLPIKNETKYVDIFLITEEMSAKEESTVDMKNGDDLPMEGALLTDE